jgi:Glutamate/Leucine/Phenylalanine/Valine dehydrogenase
VVCPWQYVKIVNVVVPLALTSLLILIEAANAGGVAVSGLEMAQNSQRLEWTPAEVDGKLKGIMAECYKVCFRREYPIRSSSDEISLRFPWRSAASGQERLTTQRMFSRVC